MDRAELCNENNCSIKEARRGREGGAGKKEREREKERCKVGTEYKAW